MRKLLPALVTGIVLWTGVPAHAIAYRVVKVSAHVVVTTGVSKLCSGVAPNGIGLPALPTLLMAESGTARGEPLSGDGVWVSSDCIGYESHDGKFHVAGGGWFGVPGTTLVTSDMIEIAYDLTQIDEPDPGSEMMFYGTWSVVTTTGSYAGWYGIPTNMNMLARYDAAVGTGDVSIFGALYCESAGGRPPPPDPCTGASG